MGRYKWWISAGIALVVIVSLILYSKRKSYELISPRRGKIIEAVYGLGTVRSHRVYEIKTGVSTSIRSLFHNEGDLVKQGSLLVGFFEGAQFRAPFSGTVTAVNFNENEVVPPQIPVIRMEDLNDLYIEVSLEQEGALRVSQGHKAKVLFESVRGEVLTGKVSSLFPKAGEFLAHIEVEKLSKNVLPGMTADVTIEVGSIEEATLIPLSSIHNGLVLVDRNGKRDKVKVKIGHVDGHWAEVIDDSIQLGDEILVPTKGQN